MNEEPLREPFELLINSHEADERPMFQCEMSPNAKLMA